MTFNPAGTWRATQDEIKDVCTLGLWLNVNGVRRQTGNIATMIFTRTRSPATSASSCPQIRRPHQQRHPPGVGIALRLPIWLQPGDVMDLGIDRHGTQGQTVVGPR